MKMHNAPHSWPDLLELLQSWWRGDTPLGAVVMSIIMAGLRIAYFGGGGGWKRKTLEILLCGALTLTFASALGFAPIFPDICYHLTHYKPAAADIPVASDNPAHYADAIRYNARTPLQGSLLPLTRLVWA
ncbi:lambda family phage holin [Escherichia coli KTE21]|nr:lambda family phage holin [Escherichia coli KTE21]EOU70138.1 lambda family phage holin [Escherichia coli KTE20]